MAERLDLSGLSYFFSKIKALFATKDTATTTTAGLMSAADKAKLDGAVTGVKGDAESEYRSGNVNLTPANLGALAKGSYYMSVAPSGGLTRLFSDIDIRDSQYGLPDASYLKSGELLAAMDSNNSRIFRAWLEFVGNGIAQLRSSFFTYLNNGDTLTFSVRVELDKEGQVTVQFSHPTEILQALGALAASQKGAALGVAELDSSGKVPASQLPSYVDDVLEYASASDFPATGEAGKIYVATDANLTYRWSGSAYVEISPSLALGETSATAYRGDRGKAAYDHAQAHGSAYVSGLYKITTNAEGHVTGAAAVAKSDITALGIPAQDTTYSAATTTTDGLMSATDKAKLDGIEGTTALSLTLASGSWSSATPPTQTITATGVTATNNIIVGIGSGITSAQYDAATAAKLVCTAQGANSITITAYGTTPTENIPISVVILG